MSQHRKQSSKRSSVSKIEDEKSEKPEEDPFKYLIDRNKETPREFLERKLYPELKQGLNAVNWNLKFSYLNI